MHCSVRPLKENQVLQKQKVALEQRNKKITLKEHIQKSISIVFNGQKNGIKVWIYQLRNNFDNTRSILEIGSHCLER